MCSGSHIGVTLLTNDTQRWHGREPRWRPAREVIDPRCYEVAEIPDDTTARGFVEQHHYSASYPAARFRFGLYRAGRLVGVAVFSQPMNDAVLACLPRGKDLVSKVEGPWLLRGRFGTVETTNRVVDVLPGHPLESTDLGRLVLLDEEGANAESFFIARCFELLRQKGITGVTSFSDPMPRRDARGRIVFVGHIGIIYQAMMAVFIGRATPHTMKVLPDGTVLNARTLQKIRKQERGHAAAEEFLVSLGARPRGRRTNPRVWLARELPRFVRNVRNPGNFKYLFGLTESVRRRLPQGRPYPKFDLLGAAA